MSNDEDGVASEREPSGYHPGQLELSDEKLKLLRPDLYGLYGFLNSTLATLNPGWSVRKYIQQHLQNGDTRAAVVVSASPLLVAAYTDELDCVAMLRFPQEFEQRYRLSEGSRLLAMNCYGETPQIDCDLIVGPNSLNKWTQFYPLIAEFLSDDGQRIENRKHEIDENEWQRALQMGKEYLQSVPGVARDGRPVYASIPVDINKHFKSPNVAVMVALFLLCIGSFVTEYFTVQMFVHATKVTTWPTAKGVVKRSDVQPEPGGTSFVAHVDYDYSVDGKPYSSSSVRTRGTSTQHKDEATNVAAKYPLNANVSVYYNAKKPTESYLEGGVDAVNYLIVIGPVVFGLLLGSIFYTQFQQWRKKRPAH